MRTIFSEPLVDFVPDQSPLAEHDDALVDAQVKVVDSPTSTIEASELNVLVAEGDAGAACVGEGKLAPPPPPPPPPQLVRNNIIKVTLILFTKYIHLIYHI